MAVGKRLGLSFYRREGAVGNYRNYDTTIYAAAQVKKGDPLSVLLSIMKKNIWKIYHANVKDMVFEVMTPLSQLSYFT